MGCCGDVSCHELCNFKLKLLTRSVQLQTSSKLYLVLDFINGGHLFFQLYRQVWWLLFALGPCRAHCSTVYPQDG